jgi:predicted nucleic acid-binding protein
MLIDTSVVLAYLGGDEATSELATQLFDAFVATGRNPASLSMVTVGEILVRPFRSGPAAVARAEGFLRHFGDMRLIGVDYDVARESARIRAATMLRTPDALILASAAIANVDLLVTNDLAWKKRASALPSDLHLVVLADVVPVLGKVARATRSPLRDVPPE